MLERTISNLEDFLKVALEYFYPIRLNFTKIAVGELLDGFMTHLSAHLNGNEVRVFRDEIGEPATILIDPAKRRLDLDVPADEMRRRLAATKAPPPRYKTGAMAKYAKLVSSASAGAVTGE